MSQKKWVNAPSEGALYGEQIRRCIIAPEGKILVGIDMKSAQLSIAAYYANNQHYYEAVATGVELDSEHKYVGQSAHCVNARMFGMVSDEEHKNAVETQDPALLKSISLRRKLSKGASFGVIFGCSGKKLAKMLNVSEKEGILKKDLYLSQMGLDSTSAKLKQCENKYSFKGGWFLPLSHGYWLWNNSSHKNINTIVQGFEALAQKLMTIKLSKELDNRNLRDKAEVKIILDVHDEKLIECKEGYEKIIGELACECYTWAANEIFKYHNLKPEEFCNTKPVSFAIDLAGGYKVGKNYYEVH